MATDRMYDLAFRYKKTKLWKKLYDSEIFAVRLSDGEIGYCCVMGMAGELNAVALYVGAEGLQSYYRIMSQPACPITGSEHFEMLLSQDCLQCSFGNKDELSDEEIAEVAAYTKAHGITLRGANAFPQFTKYRPYYHPWDILSDIDRQRISEALEACTALAERLQDVRKNELGFSSIVRGPKAIPMFVREGDGFVIVPTEIPPEAAVEYPAPKAANDITVARLKGMKKQGVLECGLVRLQEPVQEEEDEAPYYPLLLLALDRKEEQILPLKPVLYFEEHSEELLDDFAETLLKLGKCPRQIDVDDARTLALLQDLCGRVGIRLRLAEEGLPMLEETKIELLSSMHPMDWDGTEEEFEDEMLAWLFEMLDQMSDSELKQMPRELALQFMELADTGILPPEVEARLRRVFRR